MILRPYNILRAIMENAGLKPKEFAEKLGISSAYGSDLLNGKRKISTKVALKIEKEFKRPEAEELLIIQVKYELYHERLNQSLNYR